MSHCQTQIERVHSTEVEALPLTAVTNSQSSENSVKPAPSGADPAGCEVRDAACRQSLRLALTQLRIGRGLPNRSASVGGHGRTTLKEDVVSVTPQTADTQRIKLRRALRGAREAAQLQPRDVAKALDWSPSKIIRIEQGAVGVATVDLLALLRLYHVSDPAEVTELEQLARNSRKLVYSGYRKVHTEAALSLFAVEQDAEKISKYAPTFLPGVIQTREFATALLKGLGNSPEDVADKVELRMQRREAFAETRGQFHVVIGEPALARNIGGPQVMAEQFRQLLAFSRRPGVSIQVMLLDRGAHPRMGGAFTVLEFADENLTTLLYLEDSTGDSLLRDDAETVSEFLSDFEKISALAEPADSLETVLGSIAQGRFDVKL